MAVVVGVLKPPGVSATGVGAGVLSAGTLTAVHGGTGRRPDALGSVRTFLRTGTNYTRG